MRVFLLRIFDKIAEDRLVIVSNNENLLYRIDLGDGLEAVLNDGMTGHFEEGLCSVRMTMSRYKEDRYLTLGTSSDKGLNRVPLLGPPTFIESQLHSSSKVTLGNANITPEQLPSWSGQRHSCCAREYSKSP